MRKRDPFNVVLASLLSKGYVEEIGDGITLTPKGKLIVKKVYEEFDDESLVLVGLEAMGEYIRLSEKDK